MAALTNSQFKQMADFADKRARQKSKMKGVSTTKTVIGVTALVISIVGSIAAAIPTGGASVAAGGFSSTAIASWMGANMAWMGSTGFQVGLGLSTATANLAIDGAWAGQISPLSTAIDFGTAFIPMATGALVKRKTLGAAKWVNSELAKNTTTANEIQESFVNLIQNNFANKKAIYVRDIISQDNIKSKIFSEYINKNLGDHIGAMNKAKIGLAKGYDSTVNKINAGSKQVKKMKSKGLSLRAREREIAEQLAYKQIERNALATQFNTNKYELAHKSVKKSAYGTMVKKNAEWKKISEGQFNVMKSLVQDGSDVGVVKKLTELRNIQISMTASQTKTLARSTRTVDLLTEYLSTVNDDIIQNSAKMKLTAKALASNKRSFLGRQETYVKKLTTLLDKFSATTQELDEIMTGFENVAEQLTKLKFWDYANKGRFMTKVNRMAGAVTGNSDLTNATSIFTNAYKGAVSLTPANIMEASLKVERGIARQRQFKAFETIMKNADMSVEGKMKVETLFNRLMYAPSSITENTMMVDSIVKTLPAHEGEVFFKIIAAGAGDLLSESPEALKEAFGKQLNLLSQKVYSKKIQFINKIGSKLFNDRVVQNIQLIDPNDLGRAPIERGYQYLKKKLSEKYAQKVANNLTHKVVHKTIENLDNVSKFKNELDGIKQLFNESGGYLIPNNRYLLGYKVLDTQGKKNVVLLKFNPFYASGDTGKNIGGKKDVLVMATNDDLKQLRNIGVQYYWDYGYGKGWWRSRGGKKEVMPIGARTLATGLSLFLGFIPIPALRNMLSITSNIVENISDMAKGDYVNNYIRKLNASFQRTLLNRANRFVMRELIGKSISVGMTSNRYLNDGFYRGAVDKRINVQNISGSITNSTLQGLKSYQQISGNSIRWMIKKLALNNRRLGQAIGRESSRYSGALLNELITVNKKNGNLEFNKNVSANKIGTRVANASITSTTRYLKKGERILQKSGMVSELIGSKRKMQQTLRVYSSVTPNGKVKPLRNLGKIKVK